MKILEINTIDYGSSYYVSKMLEKEFKKVVETSVINSIKRIYKNPFKWWGFYFKCKHYDILHTHLGKASQFTSFFKSNSIQVSTLHGFQRIKHYKKSDYYTAVSTVVKEHYIKQGVDSKRIKVIPNGVSSEFFNIPFRINKNQITLLQVGHLTKNIDFSFKVIKNLKDKDINVKVLFAGGESGNCSDLLKKAEALNIKENIKFLGFVDNIVNVYAQSDILISSSIKEGFCLPILEAMAAGMPVVTLDNGGSNDYFVNNKNGFVCKNLNEFNYKLELLINDHFLRLEISKRNREKAKKYTWEKISSDYIKYFSSILNK